MNEKEIKKLIGKEKFEELKKIVRKARKQGKSPDEIAALTKKFLNDLVRKWRKIIGHIEVFFPKGR